MEETNSTPIPSMRKYSVTMVIEIDLEAENPADRARCRATLTAPPDDTAELVMPAGDEMAAVILDAVASILDVAADDLEATSSPRVASMVRSAIANADRSLSIA